MCEKSSADLRISDPGRDVDLDAESDSKTSTWVCYGDPSVQRALDDGLIALCDPRPLCADLPSWLQLSIVTAVPRRHGSARSV